MTLEPKRDEGSFDKLEAATHTLQKERDFFNALMSDKPVALLVNRIIHLVTFFQITDKHLPPYLSRRSSALFNHNPEHTASVLAFLLSEITRSARLAAYLSVKGIVPQAIAAMRAAIEQIGVYTHIWYEPEKAQHVGDPDSDSYGRAFRHSANKSLLDHLKAKQVKYRFMHCKGGVALSNMYKLLSDVFVHGFGASPPIAEGLSCEFIDRGKPADLAWQYTIVQMLLSLVFSEIIMCIPKEDWFDDDIAAIMLVSTLFLPTLAQSSGEQDPTLQEDD